MPETFKEIDIEDIYHRHVDTVYRVCFMFMKTEQKLNSPDYFYKFDE